MSTYQNNPENASDFLPELTLKNKLSSSSNYSYFNSHNNSNHNSQIHSPLKKVPTKSPEQVFKLSRNILKKSPQIRSPADNQILMQLLDHNKFLADLVQNVSIQCFKGIMKQAKIQEVRQRQLLCEEGKPVTHIVVLLEGKLGICKQQDDFNQAQQGQKTPGGTFKGEKTPRLNSKNADLSLSKMSKEKQTRTIATITPMDNLFDQLTAVSCKQIQNIRKKNVALKRKSSVPLTAGIFLPMPYSKEDFQSYQIENFVNPGEQYGARVRCRSKYHTNTCFAVEKSILLIIQFNLIVYWVEHAFRDKLGQMIDKLKKIPSFSFLQDGKLAQCVLFMKKQKKRRNDYLYKQGEKSDKLYILIHGQIKLAKEAKLFQENPNQLYMDRRKLMNKSTQLNKKDQNEKKVDVLPYANFTTLYNFRPMKKNIQIGVITTTADGNFNLIGQSQLLQRRARQTDAIVTSFDCQYYQIQIKKLQQILGSKFIEQFYDLMAKSLRKVILYRQNEYSQKVNWQNKQNLDYFYYKDNKVKQSPRKYKIEKINNKFSQTKYNSTNNVNKAIDIIQPFYTTFNFHKLIKSQRLSHTRKSSKLESQKLIEKRPLKKDSHNQKDDSDSQQSLKVQFSQVQQRLVGMSHTWKTIKKKVAQQIKVMQKISTKKHRINIKQPLIDQQYFEHVENQQRRINREHKIFVLSLGKRTKW